MEIIGTVQNAVRMLFVEKRFLYVVIGLSFLLLTASNTIADTGYNETIIPACFSNPPPSIYDSIPLLQQLEKDKINITLPLMRLEYAVSILDKNPEQAKEIASETYNNLTILYNSRDALIREKHLLLAEKIAGILILIIILVIGLPRAYLKIWYKINKKRLVMKTSKPHPSFLFDEEVQAVIAAIIVIGIVFSIAQLLAPSNPEPFSELGLLGPNKKIGDYPKDVVKGENITLYIYVGNHLGNTSLYRIDFKIDKSNNTLINETETPLNITAIKNIYVLLGNNQTTIIPFSFAVNETGRLRLVWEMYIYEPSENTFTYHKRWVHLWINVIPPSLPER